MTHAVAPTSRVAFRLGLATAAVYCAFQLLFPLRHLMYDGDVLWNEQGMRYSWKVMVREKNGSVTYRARDRATGRQWDISPYSYLTWRQTNEMSGQPDLILQLGKHIAGDLERAARTMVDALGADACREYVSGKSAEKAAGADSATKRAPFGIAADFDMGREAPEESGRLFERGGRGGE